MKIFDDIIFLMYLIHRDETSDFLRIARGEELVACVQKYCQEHSISGAWVQAIGACDKATVSYYNLSKREYIKESFEGEFEILSLQGNISLVENTPFLHAHVTLGNSEYKVIGGHLHSMRISGTGEVYIRRFENKLTRSKDEETGLALLDGRRI